MGGRSAAQPHCYQLLEMIERSFDGEPFPGHLQPRARRLDVCSGERIQRRHRPRQVTTGKRCLCSAHGRLRPGL